MVGFYFTTIKIISFILTRFSIEHVFQLEFQENVLDGLTTSIRINPP